MTWHLLKRGKEHEVYCGDNDGYRFATDDPMIVDCRACLEEFNGIGMKQLNLRGG